MLGIGRDLVKEIEHDERRRRWRRSGGSRVARDGGPGLASRRGRCSRLTSGSSAALGLAFAFLNRRERTAGEVRVHLERKGVAGRAAEAAASQILTARRATWTTPASRSMFVHDKRELERWGSERIERGLLGRGIDRDLIETALSATSSSGGGETEFDRALALLRRRFPPSAGPPRTRPRPRRPDPQGLRSELAPSTRWPPTPAPG